MSDQLCFYCGHWEGDGGRPPIEVPEAEREGDDRIQWMHMDVKDFEPWCDTTLPRGWRICDSCLGAFPGHVLMRLGGERKNAAYTCRRCADPQLVVGGGYERIDCVCDRCVDRAWGAATKAPGRARASSDQRRAAGPRAARSNAPSPTEERQGRLREALAAGSFTSEELAASLKVAQKTVQRDLRSVGAVPAKDGKSVTWSLPTQPPEAEGS